MKTTKRYFITTEINNRVQYVSEIRHTGIGKVIIKAVSDKKKNAVRFSENMANQYLKLLGIGWWITEEIFTTIK